jgi:NNP family nitrate/nitrite transporter-like MFS transporter
MSEKTYSSADITDWRPRGQRLLGIHWQQIVAYRNLWISIPNLLVGFAVWGMWGIITVQMLNLGFPFKPADMFGLTAIAGLMGATLRIPASFFIKPLRRTQHHIPDVRAADHSGGVDRHRAAGQEHTAVGVPGLRVPVGHRRRQLCLLDVQHLQLLSQAPAGNRTGLNAGLGNFGVTTMQVLIPLVMTVGVFGAAGGGSMVLLKDSGWILGKIVAGTPTYIQNAGFIWAAILVPLVLAAWFGMNNLMTLSPNYGGTLAAFAKIVYLWGITCAVGALGLYLYLPAPTGLGLLNMWVALPLIIVATLLVMKLAAFGEMKGNIAKQFEIFSNKHTWSLTLLYIVTFGSFIGFSMALPLSITVIFGVSHVPDAAGVMQHTLKNPNAPSALTYAWIGPFVGALIRPVGGWISDKVGGSIVTQVISAVMVVASGAVGYVMMQAYGSATPEQYFSTFMWLFVLLFAASGIGNGSTFRTIGVIFDRQQTGPVLGWTSAVAAYGAFIAPVVIGAQIKAGTPQTAMYGFAIFYALCLVLNWWFYLRAGSEIKNP